MKFKFIFQYTSHFSLIPTYVFINILDKFYLYTIDFTLYTIDQMFGINNLLLKIQE